MIYGNAANKVTLPNGPMLGLYETLRDTFGIVMSGGVDGEFASKPAQAQSVINGWTESNSLTWARKTKAAIIDAYAKARRDSQYSTYSQAEIALWTAKKAEADAIVNATGAPTPLLSAEATARGVTLSALATKVQNNYSAFTSLEAQIAGVAGKHKDAIQALTLSTDVMTYDHTVGWP